MSAFRLTELITAILLCSIVSFQLNAQEQGCRYEGSIRLEPVWDDPILGNSGPYDPGDYEMKIHGDLIYVDCALTNHKIESGTVVNGASIPRGAWTILGYTPWSGRTINPAIVHDSMCERAIFTSKRVHNLFHEGLITSKVSRLQAALMYAAVSNFGPQWSTPGGPVTRPTYSEGFMRLIERLLKQGKDIVFGRIFTEEATDAQNFVSVEEAKPEMKIAEPEDETFSTDRAVVDQLSKDIKRVPPEFVDQLMEEGYVELQ